MLYFFLPSVLLFCLEESAQTIFEMRSHKTVLTWEDSLQGKLNSGRSCNTRIREIIKEKIKRFLEFSNDSKFQKILGHQTYQLCVQPIQLYFPPMVWNTVFMFRSCCDSLNHFRWKIICFSLCVCALFGGPH